MKISELPEGINLGGIKFRVPKNHPECPLKTAYWSSQWGYPGGEAGVWCKKSIGDTQVYPIFLKKLSEALKWEVVS